MRSRIVWVHKTGFDVLAKKPAQSAIIGTRGTRFKPIGPVDQSDVELVLPGDHKTYIDLNGHMIVHGEIANLDGSEFDATEQTSVVHLLYSLIIQFSVTGNSVSVTPSKKFTFVLGNLTHGHGTAKSILTSAFWCLDDGDMLGENQGYTGYTYRSLQRAVSIVARHAGSYYNAQMLRWRPCRREGRFQISGGGVIRQIPETIAPTPSGR